MKRLFLLSMLASACAPESELPVEVLPTDRLATTGVLDGHRVKWIMWTQDEAVSLTSVDHDDYSLTEDAMHDVPNGQAIGVAGNKLLWQGIDSEDISIWTIDSSGAYVSHNTATLPDGYRARSIRLMADGCSQVLPEFATYEILIEHVDDLFLPKNLFAWTVDDNGVVINKENLLTPAPGWTGQDQQADHYGRVARAFTHDFSASSKVERWSGFNLIRTDVYSTNGNDYQAPSSNHTIRAFRTAQQTDGVVFEDLLLWTKGPYSVAELMLLNNIGKPVDSMTLSHPDPDWEARAMSGPGLDELVCDGSGSPPGEPEE